MHLSANQNTLNISFNCFTGSGIGTLTFGPVLQYILQRYGLAISLRILSGVTLLLLVVALSYKPFRSPLEELFEVKRQPAPFFDFSIWQNRAFCVYTAAVSLFMLGYFIPYVHLVSSPQCFISPPPPTPMSPHRVSSLPLGKAIVLSPFHLGPFPILPSRPLQNSLEINLLSSTQPPTLY